MRTRKLPAWGSETLYTAGPAAGTPTKIAPPTEIFQNGFIPGEPMAAQYDTYWRHHIARQVDLSARTALTNWRYFEAAAANVPLQCAFVPKIGVTLLATAEPGLIRYIPDAAPTLASVPSINLTAASGAFVPKAVCVSPLTGRLLIGGTNSTAPGRSVWSGDVAEVYIPTELPTTGLGADGVALMTVDSATGIVVLFFSDTTSAVRTWDGSGSTLAIAGSRATAPHPALTGARAAVHGGVAVIAYNSGGVIKLESGTVPTGAFTEYTPTFVAGTPGAVLDLRWSDSYQCWLLLTQSELLAFTSPAGPYTSFVTLPSRAAVAGCLFDVGAMVIEEIADTRFIYTRDDLDTLDDSTVIRQALGVGYSGSSVVIQDGSAIWVNCGAGSTAGWQRTLRVS